LTAAIRQLANSGSKVVCTTHFLEIFSLRLLEDGHGGVQALQMMVHLPESDEEDAIPLFQLLDGVSKSSAGLVCAKMAGVTTSVVKRAHEIIGSMKNGEMVRAVPSHLNSNSVFQPNTRSALRKFLEVRSWKDLSEQELLSLKDNIMLM
jgi:DNA mismatch repair protein MSH5